MAELHPLVAGFAGEVYDRGRPAHGPEITAALARELALAPGARVLDLGAGTGKLSRALVQAGFDVVAVEPLDHMRAVLAEVVGPERALAGTAEAIPLGDGAVDAVTMADAFHWFDERPAIEELRRVLRPGGGVAVLWTVPLWTSGDDGWGKELWELVAGIRPDHPVYSGRGAVEPFAEAGGFAPVRRVEVDVEQESDREAVLAYVASISWVGALSPAERSEFLGRVEELLDRHGVTRARHPVHTEMYVTRLL